MSNEALLREVGVGVVLKEKGYWIRIPGRETSVAEVQEGLYGVEEEAACARVRDSIWWLRL
jgi:hypothetical protein